jgi:hypothetical protein
VSTPIDPDYFQFGGESEHARFHTEIIEKDRAIIVGFVEAPGKYISKYDGERIGMEEFLKTASKYK